MTAPQKGNKRHVTQKSEVNSAVSSKAKPAIQKVRLDDVIIERLPERIIKSIGEIEITLTEAAEMETKKPRFQFSLTEKEVRYELRGRIPVKRVLAYVSAAAATTWAAIQFAIPYLMVLLHK